MKKKTNENVIYREVQQFRQIWIWCFIVLLAVIGWYSFFQQIVFGKSFGNNPAPDSVMWITWIALGIGIPLLFYCVKLTVEVNKNRTHIRFFPLYSRIIPFKDLNSYKVSQYRPISDYGGWGIRWSSEKGWAYNVSGNLGVELELSNGKRLLIGSQNPEKLIQMIGEAQKI
ncbi:MAG: hypothetical protein KAS53_07110 [Candidatus Cloacimonetes bacterium]|nr:hypothetical protein [Candidatus Cloacimonadota bacterium]